MHTIETADVTVAEVEVVAMRRPPQCAVNEEMGVADSTTAPPSHETTADVLSAATANSEGV